jgi:hypothetical protein
MADDTGRLMAVRAELVHEHLVAGILAAVEEKGSRELSDRVNAVLDRTAETVLGIERATEAPSESVELAAALARHGYLTRVAEAEMFDPARQPIDWLADSLRDQLAANEGSWEKAAIGLSRDLAEGEPDERPDPEGGAPSWRVPGPGGHVRYYVAREAIAGRCPKNADGRPLLGEGIRSAAELKRCWMFGFLLRCCEETAPLD